MEALLSGGVFLLVLVVTGVIRSRDEEPRPVGNLGPLEIRLAGATCKVCGSGMTSRIILCSRCRTAHHEECWTYAGKCATYACGASRAIQGRR